MSVFRTYTLKTCLLALLGPIGYGTPVTRDSLPMAQTPAFNAMAEEAVLTDAIRMSLEKFSAAEAILDNPYIRVQAMALKKYSDLLIESLTGARTALQEYRAAVEATGLGDIETHPDSSIAFQERVTNEGFFPEEVAIMISAGFDTTEIESLRTSIEGWDLANATGGTALANIDSIMATNLSLLEELETLADSAQIVIDTTSLVWIEEPRAAAGGAYSGPEGSLITFDGSQSTDPRDRPLTFDWDLDADGVFGDEIGSVVQYSWQTEGRRLVGLKVTNIDGYYDVAYARVEVSSVKDGPVFLAIDPDSCYVPLSCCDSLTFAVSTDDPDGDSISYEWTLTDSTVSSTSSWYFEAASVDSGKHRVSVRIDDGSLLSPDNSVAWRIHTLGGGAAVKERHDTGEGLDLAIQQISPVRATQQVTIAVSLPHTGVASPIVYDVSGSHVRTLTAGSLEAGTHRVMWDGRDETDRQVAPGVYLCHLTLGGASVSQKIVLLR